MNLSYDTRLTPPQAAPPALRQQAAQALSAPSPFRFPGAHQDVYAGLASQNATAFDRAAQQADAESMSRWRDTQSQMALRGLQQMAQAQDNQRSLATQAYGQQMGFLGDLLQGLFR